MPDMPFTKLSHKDWELRPNGEIDPSPVITTLFFKIILRGC